MYKIILFVFLFFGATLQAQKIGVSYVRKYSKVAILQGGELSTVYKRFYLSADILHGKITEDKYILLTKKTHVINYGFDVGVEFNAEKQNILFIPYFRLDYNPTPLKKDKLNINIGFKMLFKISELFLISYDHKNTTQAIGFMYNLK